MNSHVILTAQSGMVMEIDFAHQKVIFPRTSWTEKSLNLLPMEINFSDITDIEFRNPKFVLAGGCNIIVNNIRYMSPNGNQGATCFLTKDIVNLKNALLKIMEMCGLSGFKEFDSVNAVKEVYTQDKVNLSNTETIKKCRVCGHIFCYSAEDVQKNISLKTSAQISRLNQFGNALGGTNVGASVSEANANNYQNQIKDFHICPQCNSRDLIVLTKEEYNAEMEAKKAPAQPTPVAAISPMDELKKLKELLDMGIITQEEFDAKKKQLLGL